VDVVHASTPSSGQLLHVFLQNKTRIFAKQNRFFDKFATVLPSRISEAKSTHRQTPDYMIQRFAGDAFLPIACLM